MQPYFLQPLWIFYAISVLGAVTTIALSYRHLRASLLSNVVKKRLQKGKNLRFRWAKRNECQLVVALLLAIICPLCNTWLMWQVPKAWRLRAA